MEILGVTTTSVLRPGMPLGLHRRRRLELKDQPSARSDELIPETRSGWDQSSVLFVQQRCDRASTCSLASHGGMRQEDAATFGVEVHAKELVVEEPFESGHECQLNIELSTRPGDSPENRGS